MNYPPSLIRCRRCNRLQEQFRELRGKLPDYWNKPVPPAGKRDARLMIVGLAPGRHGANRTGLPFTGDASGALLFETLDELRLSDEVAITNAVKCLPINNRPVGEEVNNCQDWLRDEVSPLFERQGPSVILALGALAHNSVLKTLALRASAYPFQHARTHELQAGNYLVDSYHCSRYNTQTGRLTPAMFRRAVAKAGRLAELI